jgi:hypothetical protein
MAIARPLEVHKNGELPENTQRRYESWEEILKNQKQLMV